MSTKITLEFFSADEKPKESCCVLAVCDYSILPNKSLREIPYSKKHDLFNAFDRTSREEAKVHAMRNVVAWAYVPDWGDVT